MLKVIPRSVLRIRNCLSHHSMVRKYSFGGGSRIVRAVQKYFSPTENVKPPYHHVCQIGDPVLRMQAEPVDLEVIPTAQFKKFVDHLIGVMRKYEAFGLAASQIGSPFQVFVIETTTKHCIRTLALKSSGQPLEVVPLRVFINPKMKILDYKTFSYPECCVSICGYSAHVPRAKTIRIEALDLSGNSFVWEADGWPAKLAQHEMDHLQGKVFTDKMDPKTFSCTNWDIVNLHRGKIALDYYPISRGLFRRMFYL